MTAAFVILAHRKPEQVARLANRLAPHHVFVHIDINVDDSLYSEFCRLLENLPHVTLIKRHRSAWASWGIVAAVLEGIKTALDQAPWTHVMVISGQDYPLMSSSQMEDFFNQHIGQSFLAHWYLPSKLWGGDGGMYRVKYWHTPFKGRRVFIPIPRRQPKGIKHVGGSMFSCLSREMANEVISFTQREPEITNFYKHVWIPDELFISTVVMNSAYKDSVIGESLSYIRWSNPGSPHPDELKIEDAPELIRAGKDGSKVGGYGRKKLFARKVYIENHSQLLDALDQAAKNE
ncbi:MAG: beta-1,6-N-acetylglucosaminyltransferase [Methylotenera sp.]|uniref:beta-1,6-N-acetylglucosaminyltransferase n=1 Tax=Methylotenera sp. TaxID=2051956 RepID=UPI002489EC23|nr:beta-1,6-N-acetylglucosaminyltransferase [Methylotenera sp.]MDI1310109.1 beta-1,6-N-acetylglucosaminyltransferase [Methylotenera sp.]